MATVEVWTLGIQSPKGYRSWRMQTTLPVTHDTGALCLHQALSRSMICDGLNAFLSVNVLCKRVSLSDLPTKL